ncbi:hypothetical protein TNCV_4910711 [Trichonephila clavipes]|nr:hypothetical protein TNCV_4910711 [Trichonephila clavipes]
MKNRRLTIRENIEQVKISARSPHAILRDHAQNICKTCYKTSVDGTEKLHLAVAQDLLDTISAEPGFLRHLGQIEHQEINYGKELSCTPIVIRSFEHHKNCSTIWLVSTPILRDSTLGS